MADKVFDNNGGAGDGYWSTAANWDPEGVPATGDTVQISADCVCNSDESAKLLAGFTIDADKTLTMASGGHVYVRNANGTINGTLAFDGGTFSFEQPNGGSHVYLDIGATGTITGSASGGTLKLIAYNSTFATLRINNVDGRAVLGNSSSRLVIDGGSGNKEGDVQIAGLSVGFRAENVDFNGIYRIQSFGSLFTLDNCLIRNTPHSGVYFYGGGGVILRDCQIDNCGVGGNYGAIVADNGTAVVKAYNTTFSQSDDRDVTIRDDGALSAYFVGCSFSSTPEVEFEAQSFADIVSIAHDKDYNHWKEWVGVGHTVERETGVVYSGDCSAKLVSSANCSDTLRERFRWLAGFIPMVKDDVVYVRPYVRQAGASGGVIKLQVDPDGVFGASATRTHTISQQDTWEPMTPVPYTATNGASGDKYMVPVYFLIETPSLTFYVDHVEWVGGQGRGRIGFDYRAIVSPIDRVSHARLG